MNFENDVRPMKWEFGYWGEAINQWYEQGLPQINYPEIPSKIQYREKLRFSHGLFV